MKSKNDSQTRKIVDPLQSILPFLERMDLVKYQIIDPH